MKSMISILMLAIALGGVGVVWPQEESVDVVRTDEGELRIRPIIHGSLMLEFRGKVIHVDPWSRGNYAGLPKADLILITDVHSDHMDRAMVDQLKKETTVILAPVAVAETIREAQVIRNGERRTVDGIAIEAVPMYNLVRGPGPGQLYHTKGRGNGYVLTLGGKRVYISGDTECVPEIKALKGIDIAFICMNLPFTMPPEEAAECVKAFRPKIVYPYHYRNSDLNVFLNALKEEPGIEVRLRKWY
ncbi:MAG: MBL fold metallo-hydrolase [Blastocatellia bacterium]|nr:MBL fold metallo-hydrolase [Blastocatellia bacterium]MCS7157165.1 MBL fold metallo-hydrolase [Blastocatellia bacterium]MCX7752372.1 MBL fold metallo-hydrolase [Blastocatellia bacterium]MDW8167253.1 MBL fold metallo-hydrolase [Acidobacteriota bacterium]